MSLGNVSLLLSSLFSLSSSSLMAHQDFYCYEISIREKNSFLSLWVWLHSRLRLDSATYFLFLLPRLQRSAEKKPLMPIANFVTLLHPFFSFCVGHFLLDSFCHHAAQNFLFDPQPNSLSFSFNRKKKKAAAKLVCMHIWPKAFKATIAKEEKKGHA